MEIFHRGGRRGRHRIFNPFKRETFLREIKRKKKRGAEKKSGRFLPFSIIDVSSFSLLPPSLLWSNPRGKPSTSPPLHLRRLIMNMSTTRITTISPPSAHRSSPSLTSRRRRISRSLPSSPMISAARLSSRWPFCLCRGCSVCCLIEFDLAVPVCRFRGLVAIGQYVEFQLIRLFSWWLEVVFLGSFELVEGFKLERRLTATLFYYYSMNFCPVLLDSIFLRYYWSLVKTLQRRNALLDFPL